MVEVCLMWHSVLCHNGFLCLKGNTAELQWLEHLWNHMFEIGVVRYENMFETGVVQDNEC